MSEEQESPEETPPVLKITPEEREELSSASLMEILIRNREFLFEEIGSGHRLVPLATQSLVYALIFAASYGAVLGFVQGISGSIVMAGKVPLAFFAALLVTLPVFYSFSIFLGMRLSFSKLATVTLAANYLACVVLFSLTPILFLFVLFSQDPQFVYITNIIFLIISGALGIGFLWKAADYYIYQNGYKGSTMVMATWSIIYVLVGLQLAWSFAILGDLSQLPIFKELEIEGNFYVALFELLQGYMED